MGRHGGKSLSLREKRTPQTLLPRKIRKGFVPKGGSGHRAGKTSVPNFTHTRGRKKELYSVGSMREEDRNLEIRRRKRRTGQKSWESQIWQPMGNDI